MNKIVNTIGLLALSAVTLNAVGTTYGTDITNVATLTYKVSGVAQNEKTSNIDTFKVDRKVDLTVVSTDSSNIIVVPKNNVGANNDTKPLTFTVTNKSNGSQDYILNASNLASGTATKDGGETDSVDFTTDLKICLDATCSAGDITGNNISFNVDETKTYYIFADILDTATDGNRGSIALTATAVNDGSTTLMSDNSGSSDVKTSVDIVFAEESGVSDGDAQYDGKHSALSAYEVSTATITVVKDSCVLYDGITGDNSKAKRIPGATIRYTIDVFNDGSTATEDATLTDTLKSYLTYSQGEIRDAACNCGTPAGSVVDSVSNVGQDFTASFATINAHTHECAYIEATIN